jgi:hypothetical protein
MNCFYLERLLKIWQSIGLDVEDAIRISVQVVSKSHIIWEKHVNSSKNLKQLENADSVKQN